MPAHLLIYDGTCVMCHGAVRIVLRFDRHERYAFTSWQSGLGRAELVRIGRDPDVLDTLVVIENRRLPGERVWTHSSGALRLAELLGGPWRAAAIFRFVVPRFIRDAAYRLLVRWRYRLFGRYHVCPTPPAHARHRFWDDEPS